MPHNFDCHFAESPDGPTTPLHFEFPDDAWAQLADFVSHAETVRQSRFLNGGIRCTFKLTLSAESKQIGFSGDLPPDDDVGVLLHRMRPFVLQKEPTYLPKICKLLARFVDNSAFRAKLKQLIAEFNGKAFQQQFKIESQGRILNSDEMLTLWLNAYEYHHCKDAESAFDVFLTLLPEMWQRALFISMMLDKARAMLNTWVIVAWLQRRDGEPLILA